MKIWIHINGVQEGPFAPEQLPFNRMDPQTPVWYEGLDYWMPASAAPVTAELLRRYYAGEKVSQDQPTVEVDCQDIKVETEVATPSASSYIANRQPTSRPTEKCPPTYMVWSIVMTLLCCNPVGIVSAVLGWTVTTKYNNYDFDGARRRSETTAWWFIITIVTSLIFTPMYMLVSM